MKEAVEQGESLSSAMEKSGIFPDYCLKMVAAGDESGRLENTLFTLADYYQDQKTMSEKVKGGHATSDYCGADRNGNGRPPCV